MSPVVSILLIVGFIGLCCCLPIYCFVRMNRQRSQNGKVMPFGQNDMSLVSHDQSMVQEQGGLFGGRGQPALYQQGPPVSQAPAPEPYRYVPPAREGRFGRKRQEGPAFDNYPPPVTDVYIAPSPVFSTGLVAPPVFDETVQQPLPPGFTSHGLPENDPEWNTQHQLPAGFEDPEDQNLHLDLPDNKEDWEEKEKGESPRGSYCRDSPRARSHSGGSNGGGGSIRAGSYGGGSNRGGGSIGGGSNGGGGMDD